MKKCNGGKKLGASLLFALCVSHPAFATWVPPVQTDRDREINRLSRDDRWDRQGGRFFNRDEDRFDRDGRFSRDGNRFYEGFYREDDRFYRDDRDGRRFYRHDEPEYQCRDGGCMIHRDFDRAPRDVRTMRRDGYDYDERGHYNSYDRGQYNPYDRGQYGQYDREYNQDDRRSYDSHMSGSDAQIEKDVRYALSPGMLTRGYEQVTAKVENGYVILSGSVQSQSDKEKLDKTIRDVKGVRDVQNNVRVQDQNSAQTTDDQLTQEVHRQLSPGMLTRGYDQVTGQVSNGYVTLSGNVQSQSDKEKLDRTIRDIKGVRGVQNNVRVLDPNSVQTTDEGLKQEVRRQLSSGIFTRGYERVTSDVRNGDVTLGGSVDSLKDKDTVEKTVRGISGVRNVTNNIRVEETRSR